MGHLRHCIPSEQISLALPCAWLSQRLVCAGEESAFHAGSHRRRPLAPSHAKLNYRELGMKTLIISYMQVLVIGERKVKRLKEADGTCKRLLCASGVLLGNRRGPPKLARSAKGMQK